MTDRCCVFTVLMGNYEILNEQPLAKESKVDFICFTDNKSLTSSSWKIIPIEPVFPYDIPRSSRVIKLCPHRRLQDYDLSLYIDNTITLKITPEKIFTDLFNDETDLAILSHSFRETVLDEFSEVLRLQLDHVNIITEQMNAYSLICPKIFEQKPYASGFMIRRHNRKTVIEAMEDWLAQVLRYSRRDQLSSNYIFSRHPLSVKALELDNRSSPYFECSINKRIKQSTFHLDAVLYAENNQKAKLLETEKQELIAQVMQLKEEILAYEESESWRITKPMRELKQALERMKRER